MEHQTDLQFLAGVIRKVTPQDVLESKLDYNEYGRLLQLEQEGHSSASSPDPEDPMGK